MSEYLTSMGIENEILDNPIGYGQEIDNLVIDINIDDFNKLKPKQGIGLDNLKRTGGNYLSPHVAESLINENQDEVPLIPKVKSFINKVIADSKKDKSFKDLMKVDWFDNELIDELIDLFPNKDYDKASKEVKDYIKEKITLKDSLKENESSDLTVKWTKVYLDNENKDPYFYTEKGLADGFEMIKGQKVKEIVGYFEDEDGDEDYDIIGYIYSKGKKDIETDYNEDDLNDIFINSLSSMKESLKENYNKPSEEHVKDYWSIMVDSQPEDVVRILTDLTTGKESFDNFITKTDHDVFDSFRDELYDDSDDEEDY
jgi:hypothetical protein